MGDFQGSPFDGFEEEAPQDSFMPEKPKQSNRGFLIAAGVIGGIIVLAVIVMLVMFLNPPSGAGNPAEATSIAISTQNAITIQTATAQVIATNQAGAAASDDAGSGDAPIGAICYGNAGTRQPDSCIGAADGHRRAHQHRHRSYTRGPGGTYCSSGITVEDAGCPGNDCGDTRR
jgi:hypothetical protein